MLGHYFAKIYFKHLIIIIFLTKMVFPTGYANVLCFVVPILAFPTNPTSDFKLNNNNLQQNFEIVEGPREFVVPLVPLREIIPPREAKRFSDTTTASQATDLDYMVYGKLYLMKTLNVADTSDGTTNEYTENPRFRINSPRAPNGNSVSTLRSNDGISFPAAPKSVVKRRPYRYKTWSQLQTFNDDLVNGQQRGHSEYRKLEERSADQMPVTSEPSTTTTTSTGSADEAVTENVKSDDSSSLLDAEALELLQELIPKSSPERSDSNNDTDGDDGEMQEKSTSFNLTTNTNFDIEDRFLINVPTKPNFTQCPEGQRKNHRGVCKPVFVHKPSPNDGFFSGRIIAPNPNVAQRKHQSSSPTLNRRREHEIPNLQLTTLFRSVVQLEKRLEKAVNEAEKQLSAMAQQGQSSSTLTTNNTEEEA